VLKAGSTLTVVESEVYCGKAGDMRLVSKATVTLAIVSPKNR
jgi:acyl-coenzyme A thioesterase PaaI-like protein